MINIIIDTAHPDGETSYLVSDWNMVSFNNTISNIQRGHEKFLFFTDEKGISVMVSPSSCCSVAAFECDENGRILKHD